MSLTAPAEGEHLSGPLIISGTGKAGETVTISENGASVTTAQVGQGGTFSASLPAPLPGSHTYRVSESGTQTMVSRTVTIAAAVSSATSQALPVSGGTSSSTHTVTALSFSTPASGSTVPAGALTLNGTGPADTDLTLTEDGISLGAARTDASGAWTFQVPSPKAGAHTYVATVGSNSSTLKLTVGAGAGRSSACTTIFSLSLKNGQRVRQPFRFGGGGSGQSYTVTVSRGKRQVGRKVLSLDASCGWSYTSKPGRGRVTYTLRESGQKTIAGKITLKVIR